MVATVGASAGRMVLSTLAVGTANKAGNTTDSRKKANRKRVQMYQHRQKSHTERLRGAIGARTFLRTREGIKAAQAVTEEKETKGKFLKRRTKQKVMKRYNKIRKNVANNRKE